MSELSRIAMKMMERFALDESASSIRTVKAEATANRTSDNCCLFRLLLCQPFDELLSQNTKRDLSALNAYSIKLDTLPFSILETEVFRRALPDKKLIRIVLGHLVGMRVLLTSNTTRLVVQNLSNVPIRVDAVNQDPKILSTVGAAADMTHGSLLTLFEFPPEHELSQFPPLQYRVVHTSAVLDPREAWFTHTVHCQDRHWTAAAKEATPPPRPRYSLRMHGGVSNFTPDEEAAMHAHGLLSIPCDQPTVVGRDAWSHAFGARFHSFPIRFIPRCQLYLRPALDSPNGGVELVNCGEVPVLVCDRWVSVGETCRLQHGDKISWIISKDCYSFPLAYVLMDAQEALTLNPHNYTFVPDTIQFMFAPLLAQIKAHLSDMHPTIARLPVFASNTVKLVQLDDAATDAPVALMPTDHGREFEFQVFWRHPVVFALRRDHIGHLAPDVISDMTVQLLGIAGSNAGSRTIHDHESALSACLRIAKQLDVSDLRPLPRNYLVQQAALQNLAECYPRPQP